MDDLCKPLYRGRYSGQEGIIYLMLGIQFGFTIFYAIIYNIIQCCLTKKDSVTFMHMVVWYVNTSTWGWIIFSIISLLGCQVPIDSPVVITSLSCLGFFGLFGCIEMCCSREGGYFRHQKTMNKCIQYMNNIRDTAPIHRIYIECYHYVTEYHTETYTDSNGHTQTRTRTTRRRVTTHTEGRNFPYDRWTDDSDYPNLPEISMEYPIVAVESNFVVYPGDDYTRNKYENFRSTFLSQMRRRDDYIDETVTTDVPGHLDKVTAKSDKKEEVPWWLDETLFYCLAILFISCPLRVVFRSRAKKHKFEVRKLYYVDPVGVIGMGNRDVSLTVNVVDNIGTVNIDTSPTKPDNSYHLPPVHQEMAPPPPPAYQTAINEPSAPVLPPPPYNPGLGHV